MAVHNQQSSDASRPLRQIYLLLFTAGVSFVLGVFIGRSSAPVQPIIKVTMPEEIRQAESSNYNFYKALPKGETTALGSGINHTIIPSPPPSSPAATVIREEKKMVSDDLTILPPPPATLEKSLPEGGHDNWILQAASFPQEKDAQDLGKRLRGKGYKVEIKSIAIKGKTWFRLYVGPYSSSSAAKEAATKLTRQEKLAPIARRI